MVIDKERRRANEITLNDLIGINGKDMYLWLLILVIRYALLKLCATVIKDKGAISVASVYAPQYDKARNN